MGQAWRKKSCQRIQETFDATSNDRRIYVWPDSRKQIVGSWIRTVETAVFAAVWDGFIWFPGGTPVCAGRLHWTGPYGQMLSACVRQMQAQKNYATFPLLFLNIFWCRWQDDVTCLSRLSSVSGLLATGGRLAAEIVLSKPRRCATWSSFCSGDDGYVCFWKIQDIWDASNDRETKWEVESHVKFWRKTYQCQQSKALLYEVKWRLQREVCQTYRVWRWIHITTNLRIIQYNGFASGTFTSTKSGCGACLNQTLSWEDNLPHSPSTHRTCTMIAFR